MTFLVAAIVFMQTLLPQPAYILDHPIDPNLLILATADGRYPLALLSDNCRWVHSDMNVWMQDGPTLSDGQNTCWVAVGDRVDATPCFANDAGECDINAGEHYWPDAQ